MNDRAGSSRALGFTTVALILTFCAMLAAVVSAWTSWEALRQNERSLLVQRRVDACLSLEAAANEIIPAARQCYFARRELHRLNEASPPTPGGWRSYELDTPETHEATARMTHGWSNFQRAQALGLLGPNRLARAEDELAMSVTPIAEYCLGSFGGAVIPADDEVIWGSGFTIENFAEIANTIPAKRDHLVAECRDIMGPYRPD